MAARALSSFPRKPEPEPLLITSLALGSRPRFREGRPLRGNDEKAHS